MIMPATHSLSYEAIVDICSLKFNKATMYELGHTKVDEYLWILGYDVFSTLKDRTVKHIHIHSNNAMDCRLFDIRVEIDQINPNRISLLKEII